VLLFVPLVMASFFNVGLFFVPAALFAITTLVVAAFREHGA
jgi:hypothetical protein